MLPSSTPAGPIRPRHVLLTGATGFVGQALLERLLSSTDARVSVLIRGRGELSAPQRLSALLDKPVFEPWRRTVGEAQARREIARRVRLVIGDLGDIPALPDDLDLVLHSASCVSFDEPLDKALASNVAGPAALYRALHDAAGLPHVVHVSTAYVSTGRTDRASESSVEHEVSWRAEITAAEKARAALETRVARGELSQGEATGLLRDLGRERANAHGWTDVYTMSKALGERVAEEMWGARGHRLTVLRPTIIESAVARPFPGWIDGYKVADPLFAAYGRGELTDFPGDASNVFDIVPVDAVVSAAFTAAALPPRAGTPRYLHMGTGSTNPLQLGALSDIVQDYFAAHPWVSRTGEVVIASRWSFSDPERFARSLQRRRQTLTACRSVLERLPRSLVQDASRKVALGLRKLGTAARFVGLYQPYTTTHTVFDDSGLRELSAAAVRAGVDDAVEGIGIDMAQLDWQRYLAEIHLPSLVHLMRGRGPVPPLSAVDGQVPAARPRRDHGPTRAARRHPLVLESLDSAQHTA